MAKFGPYSTLVTQLPYSAQFAAAFDYVGEIMRAGSTPRARIEAMAPGSSEKIELADGTFAIEQVYFTKPRPEGFFESHRKYIDVQIVVAGEELMEVEDISRLAVSHDYDAERDLIKYAETSAASRLAMRAGDIALFYPSDGHMPSLQLGSPVLVHKTVVKVPVS
jgi:YhcH/YjgK/YiaL family protein